MAEDQEGESVQSGEGQAGESGASNAAQDARFQVDFIAGKIRIPVASLAEWVPGKVIEHEGVFYPKVKAVCNGRTIAEGELVAVGEQIGFRVTGLRD